MPVRGNPCIVQLLPWEQSKEKKAKRKASLGSDTTGKKASGRIPVAVVAAWLHQSGRNLRQALEFKFQIRDIRVGRPVIGNHLEFTYRTATSQTVCVLPKKRTN